MKTRIVEVTNGPNNWGKFLLGQLTDEWNHRSEVDVWEEGAPIASPLLSTIGFRHDAVLVLDLQTREGAMFTPHGVAKADLDKHRIWVCPLFEPFLEWLYAQPRDQHGRLDLDQLPPHVDLPNAPFAFHGYRREGQHG